jgi:phosphatidylglycerophosphate synthase
VNPKLWPNLVSGTRIALMPAVLAVAIAGSRRWFVILVVTALATDALDGYLARRLNAFTEFGRKLDSAADYLVLVTGLAGIALLWPDIVQRELPWIVAGLTAFFAVIVYGFARLGRALCYHTWVSKLGVAGCALSLIPLLAGWSAAPFHAMVILLILAGIEEMTIAMLVPAHVGEMPSVWHAWRMRRENTAMLKPVRRIRVAEKAQ